MNALEMLVVIACCLASSYHYLHVLQLTRYQIPDFRSRMPKMRDRVVKLNLIPALFAAALHGYLPYLFSMFVKGEQARKTLTCWLVLVLYIGFTAFIFWKDCNRSARRPFMLTKRVLRLAAVIVPETLIAELLLTLVGLPYYVAGAAVVYMVWLAALILEPIENRLNKGFYDEARKKRAARKELKVVAIAGSFGKTNVKYILRELLDTHYEVLTPPGSFNTAMGISRVIIDELTPAHQVFIAELGAQQAGEIHHLARLVKPQYAVITGVDDTRLNAFGSMENVASSVYELVEALPKSGCAVFGEDEYYIDRLYAKCPIDKARISVSDESGADLYATAITFSKNGTRFKIVDAEGTRIWCETRLLGLYAVKNILLSASIALRFGLTLSEISDGIGQLEPIEHHLELREEDGFTVIDDTFNNRRDGIEEAIRVLGQMKGQRVLILSSGCEDSEESYRIGTLIADNVDRVIFVGEQPGQRSMRKGMLKRGFARSEILSAEDINEAKNMLSEVVQPDGVVLLEGQISDFEPDLQ